MHQRLVRPRNQLDPAQQGLRVLGADARLSRELAQPLIAGIDLDIQVELAGDLSQPFEHLIFIDGWPNEQPGPAVHGGMHLLIAEADGCCRVKSSAGVPAQEVEVRISAARLGGHSPRIDGSVGLRLF
jgi:hypothetical protein